MQKDRISVYQLAEKLDEEQLRSVSGATTNPTFFTCTYDPQMPVYFCEPLSKETVFTHTIGFPRTFGSILT